MKVEDICKYKKNKRMTIRWMCGVKLSDRKSSKELLNRLDMAPKTIQMFPGIWKYQPKLTGQITC
jgi:hypothetical protein